MKKLYLLRHAKSSWDDPNLADFDRPINQRGIAAAHFMGELMAGNGQIPDEIVSSPATRAVQTATLLKESSGFDAAIRLDERIYEASPHTLFQVISAFRETADSVLMIGHNPGFEGVIAYLTGTMVPMPTAGLAVVEFDIEKWSEIEAGTGKLVEVIRPKEAASKQTK
jgi:phosphohistidine phosphatase